MGSRSDEGRSLTTNLTGLLDLASTAGSTDLFADKPSIWPLIELSPPVTFGRNHQRQQALYPQSLVLDIRLYYGFDQWALVQTRDDHSQPT